MAKNKIIIKKFLFRVFLILLFLLPFNFLLYKIFSVRSLSFGCFDDCANYMAGYFMLHGRELYSEIFYNHIMGMAWLSFFIQKLHYSINLYDLVLVHRKAIMVFAFLFDFLIIYRFKWKGLLFVLLYELSKFYVFGDRFLGESLVVYAAVYLVGLVFEKFNNSKISLIDLIISGIFTWFIIFMREPYIPLAILLYILILWGKIERQKVGSIIIFCILIFVTAVNTNIQGFIFNDYTVNSQTAIKSEVISSNLFGSGILKIIFYPLILFFEGKWTNLRIFEISLSAAFIIGIFYEFFRKRRALPILLILILSLSNIRPTIPGTVFFEAYHQMVWFGLFLFITILLCSYVLKNNKTVGIILFSVIVLGWGIAVFLPKSYLYDKINLQEQLLTNFGNVMNIGNVIHGLSNKNDTLFLDGGDDMIIWQSKRFTPYKYSWYTSVMPQIPLYRNARLDMFKNNPPDFYYDYCSASAPYHPSLPSFIRSSYQQLNYNRKPGCLWVKKSKLDQISKEQWEKAKEGFFEIPPSVSF